MESSNIKRAADRRIFVYEHVTGGGLLAEASETLRSLLPEASAMAGTLATDFAAVPGVTVERMHDARLAPCSPNQAARIVSHPVTTELERAASFDDLARSCDGVVLIAPETNGILASLARRVEQLGGRLLTPSSAFCAWAGDKSAVAESMRRAGVAAPAGLRLTSAEPWPFNFPLPAVLKPNDGCGSQAIRKIVEHGSDGRTCDHAFWRLEQFVPGQAASVALLGGGGRRIVLLPCLQKLSDDGAFAYLGGSCPVTATQHTRILGLVDRCWPAIPDFRGFIGLDLVLGPSHDGDDDYLIEVNPRLTTSYVALRELAECNLAAVWVKLCDGVETECKFGYRSVAFSPDGTLRGDLVPRERVHS